MRIVKLRISFFFFIILLFFFIIISKFKHRVFSKTDKK